MTITPVSTNRRAFLALVGIGAGAALGAGRRHLVGLPTPKRLRPPGARSEADFLAACIRCGQCVIACPPDALRLADLEDGIAAGAPLFDSRENPCNLCAGEDELHCIAVCPTTALNALDDRADARIGTAAIDSERCFAWNDTVCRACWHACPYPNSAITLDWKSRPQIVADACTGCGLCDHACLTEPSSIRIAPFGVGVDA
ncbi:MAG: 4Fe-4S dicluster domain-containing protein [Planctomycetes bacterium]|nr:4Fe-4S dicluster domain-containing protein [Planctomycetota bacterium]MCB9904517.1 4Fe-4S dicluster domain-containing protein [Planctomycetota bacterium]